MTRKDPFLEICDKTKWFFHEDGLNYSGLGDDQKGTLKSLLKSVLRSIERIESIFNFNDKPTVAFCGRTNAGKSTLMNALLGDVIAPVKAGDWSSRPVEYCYASAENQEIFVADQWPPAHKKFCDANDLHDQLTILAAGNGDLVVNRDSPLIVNLNVPLLQSVTIADLPGFFATDGTKSNIHDSDVIGYLRNGKNYLQIFFVCDAKIPPKSEIEFIRKNIAEPAGNLNLIINYRSHENINERKEDLKSSWRQQLSNCLLEFTFLNAKHMTDPERNELLQRFDSLADGRSRREFAVKQYINLFADMKAWLEYKRITGGKNIFLLSRYGILNGLIQEYGNKEMINSFNQFWRS